VEEGALMARPRIGQPPRYRHRGGIARHTISIPKDLSEWLKEEAHKRDMKLSALIVELLEEYKAFGTDWNPVDWNPSDEE
jgi:hypothetical protein